ncbi:MAG TPA: OsmC family protein [Xanthobacteraceae bacterium]|nr:OsmC family protein [Xanthobacteraceae bacterium]
MPTYKSFRYRAKTTWASARRGLLSAVEKPNIVVGSPPEFKGEPDIWTPEELLVGSLNTCIMLTFLSIAQARGLTPASYESEAEGLLENVEGKFRLTEVTVRPHITVKGEGEIERAREIIERAEDECFISNSVKSKVKIVAEFSGAPSPN